ncbi:hypothetical protein FRUB_02847 [Fimbriiglobus ruber]|uniref:Thioredoxin domain-containing protein n=2 Tax=Fimbriiglobus ruber TaxID=1908690 RepID=A0A225DXJ5_9BACT|nr:hypothetical protein FRUB_02847 [Fimbriiglobus ruber]
MRGDELVYTGEATEAGETFDNRFRKRYELEVRVFVLEVQAGTADCALFTRVRPLADPVVAGAATVVTGANPDRANLPSAVRLDLIRVDARGRVSLLSPPPGPPPIPIGPELDTLSPPLLPIDTFPTIEHGMFVPLPAGPVALETAWEMADADRPPVVRTAAREGVWNGGRCIETTTTQQTDGWDRVAAVRTGWKRTETVLVSPADGFAVSVSRKIERRDGSNPSGWVDVQYELRPTAQRVGTRYTEVRREIEAAYCLAQEVAPMLPKAGQLDPQEFRAKMLKIDRFLATASAWPGTRDACTAVRRRCEAATRGECPALSPPEPARHTVTPRAGLPAPDFVAHRVDSASQFRLSAERGRPVVLVFFKPESKTSRGALAVAEALSAVYAGRVSVAALAVAAGADAADRQRIAMRLTVPVLDGANAKDSYAIDGYPKFFVVGPDGTLVWQFDGYGGETGYLVKREVDKLLARESSPASANTPARATGKFDSTWCAIRARLGFSGARFAAPLAYDGLVTAGGQR